MATTIRQKTGRGLLFPLAFLLAFLIAGTATAASASRAAYADFLSEKLHFMIRAEEALLAAGYSGEDGYRNPIPGDFEAELMWTVRKNAAVTDLIMEIVSDTDEDIRDRQNRLSNLARSVASFAGEGFVSAADDIWGTGWSREIDDSEAGFAKLVAWEEDKAERMAFMLDLALAFELDLTDGRSSLRLEDEWVDILWERKLPQETLRQVGRILADEGWIDTGDFLRILDDPNAYYEARERAERQRYFSYLADDFDGLVPLDLVLPDSVGVVETLSAPGFLEYAPVPLPEGFFPDIPAGRPANGLTVRRLAVSLPPAFHGAIERIRDERDYEEQERLIGVFKSSTAFLFMNKGPSALEIGAEQSLYTMIAGSYAGKGTAGAKDGIRLWDGTPLEEAPGMGYRLAPWGNDAAEHWLALLAVGGEDAVMVSSRLDAEGVRAHMAGLSLMKMPVDPDGGELALREGGEPALCLLARDFASRFLWLALNGGEEEVARLMGPLDTVWVYWPGNSPDKPWVELSRGAEASKTPFELGKSPVLSLSAEAHRQVFGPLAGELLLNKVAGDLMLDLPYIRRYSAMLDEELAAVDRAVLRAIAARFQTTLPEADSGLLFDLVTAFLLGGRNEEYFDELVLIAADEDMDGYDKRYMLRDWAAERMHEREED